MGSVTISLRVDEELHNLMKLHEEINWSAVLRKSIHKTVEQMEHIDTVKAEQAAKVIDTLRKSKAFTLGKKSVEVIREWRERRK